MPGIPNRFLKYALIKTCLVLFASFFVIGSSASAETKPPYTPKALPDFYIYDTADKPLRISDFKGKVVLLNFWATWCNPCVKEMPDLDKLQKDYANRGLVVITASQDMQGMSIVDGFFSTHKLNNLTPYVDKDSFAFSSLGLSGLPSTLLIDANGKEAVRMSGFIDWSSVPARTVIDDLLKRAKAGKAERT
ncbi:MAG: TlpA family protein disulfide reductase [Proteobacteria bacterium]|nr:TlpA family protein disulfide reductase [Pseudomonadota bacterium]